MTEVYTIRKLKSWKTIEKELKPLSIKWKTIGDNLLIEFKDIGWNIYHFEKFKQKFGSKVEVRKYIGNPNFTHIDKRKDSFYHESWFEPEFIPIEFITKKDMEL